VRSSSIIIALMMEAARNPETSVNFYQATRRNNPEDSHLHTHRSVNLKFYMSLNCFSLCREDHKKDIPCLVKII
jgi:hypothetical protein